MKNKNNTQKIIEAIIKSKAMEESVVVGYLAQGKMPPFYTFHEWNERGYRIIKGEHPIKVKCTKYDKKKGFTTYTLSLFGEKQVKKVEAEK